MKVLLVLAILAATAFAKPAKPSNPFALKRGGTGRINGGEDASPGEFPYQLSYQWGLFGIVQHVCGASIVTATWAVSAAHCVTQVPEIGDFTVIAGITDLYQDSAEKQTVVVTDKYVHPDYDTDLNGGVGPNDISLFKLQTALVFGDLVKAIALPAADAVFEGDVILSGWGAINPDADIFPIIPEILQKAVLPILDIDECTSFIDGILQPGEDNPLDAASNICTGPLEPGTSACSGDSGGPLAQDDTLVGVVSWGFIPCGSGAPSVFTKVSNFIDFIEEHVDDLPK